MNGVIKGLLHRAVIAALILGLGQFMVAHGFAQEEKPEEKTMVRFAVFNIKELSTESLEQTDAEGVGQSETVRAAAEIVRRVRPDVLLVNEIDHDYAALEEGAGLDKNARLLNDAYLNQGPDAIDYPYIYVAPCNTGILTGHDLNDDGIVATEEHVGTRDHGNDTFGFGAYPGQYSMAVFSQFPIDRDDARTFQKFLWKDLPGHHIPPGYYSEAELEIFRLSSKSHWDVPVRIDGRVIHLLASHPTPPVFDGEEDRNGRRNFDEIKFWVHYIENDEALYDDAGNPGGLAEDASFVIAGDLNADPRKSPVTYDGKTAIGQLLNHPRVQDPKEYVTSKGAPAEGQEPGPPNYPELATAGWGGGYRVDYVLPSADLNAVGGGVFWPDEAKDPKGAALAGQASDHRLVWVDLQLQPGAGP